MPQYVILFDGVCNLCNTFVQFIIKHDKKDKFSFAPLQSNYAIEVIKNHNLNNNQLQSVVFIANQKIYTKSNAALQIAKHLGGLWSLFGCLNIFPLKLRDAVYNYVAKNRYKWFGKKQSCMVPTANLKNKFLQ
ncbi:MAG: thiol-disulfide oxidoreductase DCC family protein [Sphingobacteriales bacterium]|nr:MAG: thiol-disulfide oxidoreductase DCC family protein [Sphingobacteriales bacterium]